MSRERDMEPSDLSAFLDGQLPPDRAEQMARALEADPQLRAELDALEATRRALSDLPRHPAPEGLHDAVMEHLERQRLLRAPATVRPARRLRWVRHLAAAAIVVLTVGLGFYLHTMLNGPSWIATVEQTPDAGPELAADVREPTQPVAALSRDKDGDASDVAFKKPAGDEFAKALASKEETADIPETIASKTGPSAGVPARSPSTRELTGGYDTYDYAAGQTLVNVRAVKLQTANAVVMNQRVGEVLARNNILPVTEDPGLRKMDERVMRSRANAFYNVQTTPSTNQVIFYVTEAQAPQIVAQLQAVEGTETRVGEADERLARGAAGRRNWLSLKHAPADVLAKALGELVKGPSVAAKPKASDSQVAKERTEPLGAVATGEPPSAPVAPAVDAIENEANGPAEQPAKGVRPPQVAAGGGMGGAGMGSGAGAAQTHGGRMGMRYSAAGEQTRGDRIGGVAGAGRDADVKQSRGDKVDFREDRRTSLRTPHARRDDVSRRQAPRQAAGRPASQAAQPTTDMGRLVQVVVTITEVRPDPATRPSTRPATTQPAATTRPASTTAPAKR